MCRPYLQSETNDTKIQAKAQQLAELVALLYGASNPLLLPDVATGVMISRLISLALAFIAFVKEVLDTVVAGVERVMLSHEVPEIDSALLCSWVRELLLSDRPLWDAWDDRYMERVNSWWLEHHQELTRSM